MGDRRAARRRARRRVREESAGSAKLTQISLCMIVRDEEEFLPGCLESVKDVADEIVVVDTGSTDRTVEIARGFGARVHHHRWADDFAAARNESLKHATRGWILVLDADERLDACAGQVLEAIARRNGPKAMYACRLVNRHDSTKVTEHIASRFFPNHCGIAYEGVVHERPVAADRRLLARGGTACVIREFVITHEGYREDVVRRRDKHDRNTVLLERALATAENPYYRYKLGSTLLDRNRVPEGVEQLERVVDDLPSRPAEALDLAIKLHSLLLLSQAHLRNGRLDQSRARAEEAVRVCPESRLAQYQMGLVLSGCGELEAARDVFAGIAAQADAGAFCPEDGLGFDASIDTWKSRAMAARCCLHLRDLAGAASFLAQAAGFVPRDPGYIEAVRRAVREFEGAAGTGASHPGDADLHILKEVLSEEAAGRRKTADDCLKAGEYAAALKLYAAALALGHPPGGALSARLAACLVGTGRREDGFAAYLSALRAKPTDPGTVRILLDLTRTFREEASGALGHTLHDTSPA